MRIHNSLLKLKLQYFAMIALHSARHVQLIPLPVSEISAVQLTVQHLHSSAFLSPIVKLPTAIIYSTKLKIKIYKIRGKR